MMSNPQDQTASFMYLLWDDRFLVEKPYQVFVPLPTGVPEECQSNMEFGAADEQVVTDIRGCREEFSLDNNGFAVSRLATKLQTFSDCDEIERVYLAEVSNLLRERMESVERIVIFDWRVRVSM